MRWVTRGKRESEEEVEAAEQPIDRRRFSAVMASIEHSVDQLRANELSAPEYRELIEERRRAADEAFYWARGRRERALRDRSSVYN